MKRTVTSDGEEIRNRSVRTSPFSGSNTERSVETHEMAGATSEETEHRISVPRTTTSHSED
jgi:hypothetical protein